LATGNVIWDDSCLENPHPVGESWRYSYSLYQEVKLQRRYVTNTPSAGLAPGVLSTVRPALIRSTFGSPGSSGSGPTATVLVGRSTNHEPDLMKPSGMYFPQFMYAAQSS